MQRLISTHVEASKIGRQIAEEVLDSQRRGGDSSSDNSPSPDAEKAVTPQVTQSSEEVLAHHFITRQMSYIMKRTRRNKKIEARTLDQIKK